MALNASKIKSNNKDYVEQEPLPAGVYPGRMVQVLDLGLQPQRPYQGKDKPPAQEIMLTYELVDTFMKDEEGNDLETKPRWISETIPLNSLKSEMAKSTKRYMAIDPTVQFGGDFTKLIDIPVNITLVQNVYKDKIYSNVAAIAAMRPKDAAKCDPLINPPKVFDADDPDMEVFGSLPEWIQDKIKGNLRYKGSKLEALVEGKPVVEETSDDEEKPW